MQPCIYSLYSEFELCTVSLNSFSLYVDKKESFICLRDLLTFYESNILKHYLCIYSYKFSLFHVCGLPHVVYKSQRGFVARTVLNRVDCSKTLRGFTISYLVIPLTLSFLYLPPAMHRRNTRNTACVCLKEYFENNFLFPLSSVATPLMGHQYWISDPCFYCHPVVPWCYDI